jgi:hypothetical protein
MQKFIAIAVASLLAASIVSASAKQKRKRVHASQPQIACTVGGCVPVPPGCGQVPGKTFDGEPTAFDVIVCPAPRYR